MTTNILVIEAHPDAGRFCGALADAYVDGARAGGADVERLVLRDLAFDPILRGGFRGAQTLEPDLVDARARIEAAAHVVWVLPVWWGSLPALLKGFIDRVFLPGWAFRNTAGRGLPEGLLAGRTARVVSTMDSPWWWYLLAHHRAAHRSLVQATLHYVGIRKVSETTVYALRTLDDGGRRVALARATEAGRADAVTPR